MLRERLGGNRGQPGRIGGERGCGDKTGERELAEVHGEKEIYFLWLLVIFNADSCFLSKNTHFSPRHSASLSTPALLELLHLLPKGSSSDSVQLRRNPALFLIPPAEWPFPPSQFSVIIIFDPIPEQAEFGAHALIFVILRELHWQ